MEGLFNFFENIRWQDVLDIAFNSYILFRLYVLFRGTVVFRVLIGIAFLWFFQRIAVSLGFIVTSWAMQGITAVAALIIIVVFRNEIRSVLQAKNIKAILWGVPQKVTETPIDIIVESVFDLARSRIGALIVFPGKEDIGDLIHGGIQWDGLVTREMIASIFWHDNPVHDGAAIIEGDRVVEVGAVLPLSRRKDLPSYYGTRHRAAVGLAESSDALVVVVSEERGGVSVAKGGQITLIRGKEQLSSTLSEHVGAVTTQWGYQRRDKLELTIAAFVSILFIAGIWFSFTGGRDTLVTLEVPVEYVNRDPGMRIVKTSVNSVNLHLVGSGALIRSLRPEQVDVQLDLSKAAVGKNTFTVTNEKIDLPPGVRLRDVDPQVVQVTLDVPTEKELTVQVDWVGQLDDGLILKDVTVSPKRVRVIGGKQVLADLSTIYTEKVSLDSITQSGQMTVNVLPRPASLRIAPGSKDKVTVAYTVGKRSP